MLVARDEDNCRTGGMWWYSGELGEGQSATSQGPETELNGFPANVRRWTHAFLTKRTGVSLHRRYDGRGDEDGDSERPWATFFQVRRKLVFPGRIRGPQQGSNELFKPWLGRRKVIVAETRNVERASEPLGD